MVKYEMARVQGSEHVICTNNSELENLLNDLKQELPRHQKKANAARNPYNEQFEVFISGGYSNAALRWWLIKWFLDRGWEPFSHFESSYDFRRIVE